MPADGCRFVLVFDGNCKNLRYVCKAGDAGYVKYKWFGRSDKDRVHEQPQTTLWVM